MIHHLLYDSSKMQLRGSVSAVKKADGDSSLAAWFFCNATQRFSIFTEFYVPVDIVIDIISKMKTKW